ncbi:MAG: hypothetical protein KAH30_00315 [Caldisericia bacterium]|nr:hypothetical protein [Caldisericia bacterium]
MKKNTASFWFAIVGFVILVAISFFINRSDTLGELTWFWGTISLFAIWPLEIAIFTFTPEGFTRHISGAMILAAMLILTNFLQTGTLTWSRLLAPACILWPIGYLIFWVMEKKTKSPLVASLAGWLGISIIAIVSEFLMTKRLTWSLPLAVLLAFWPAASIAFPGGDEETTESTDEVVGKKEETEEPRAETE